MIKTTLSYLAYIDLPNLPYITIIFKDFGLPVDALFCLAYSLKCIL